MFVISLLFLANQTNAITVGSCSQFLDVEYYTVPDEVTHYICLNNNNTYTATITMTPSSSIAGMIEFSENPVVLAPGEQRYIPFNVTVTQQLTWNGLITLNFYVPGDNVQYGVWSIDITIRKGSCVNGETKSCIIDGCAGTQTCSNNEWGECIKNDPQCGECQEAWSCTAWSECVDGIQIRDCTDTNECGTQENKPITFKSCTSTCTENWSCTAWSQCISGTQTRNCDDLNECGTTNDKPDETQSCQGNCTENWSCTNWGSCQSNNTQTRICTDSSNCETTSNKPAETQSCTYNSGGSSGGGGGGGGGGGPSVSTTTTISFTTSGVNVSLMKNYIAKFVFSGAYHTITVKNIGADYVDLEIASTPVTITLKLLESKNLDLNNDNYYDLYVELNEIKSNKAYLTVKSIHEIITPITKEKKTEIIPEKTEQEENTTISEINETEQLENEEQETLTTPTGAAILQNFNISTTRGKIILGIAVLVVVAGIVIFTRKKH